MARIVYEDDLVTEYDDGTEEVRFTQDEHEFMAANPAMFGLACHLHGAGQHWLRDQQLCMICEVGFEGYDYDEDVR